jgi:hypothetical protein
LRTGALLYMKRWQKNHERAQTSRQTQQVRFDFLYRWCFGSPPCPRSSFLLFLVFLVLLDFFSSSRSQPLRIF